MKLLVMAIVLLSLWGKEGSIVLGDIGTATSYDPPYTPTECYGYGQEQFPPRNMIAAVNEWLWNSGAACGMRYRLTCLSGIDKPCKDGTIDVVVVDFRPKSSSPSTLLLSKDAFAAFSSSPNEEISIEYIQV